MLPRLRAALFDMDGTIFDSKIDLNGLRQDLGLARDGRGILEQITALPEARRARGIAALLGAEAAGVEAGDLIPGAAELLAALQTRGVRCALVTNNSRVSLEKMLERFPLPFDLTLSRDDGPTKPSPQLFHAALEAFSVPAREAISFGDAHLDLLAAHAAGVSEIVLVNAQPWVLGFVPPEIPHRRAADLFEARTIVESLWA